MVDTKLLIDFFPVSLEQEVVEGANSLLKWKGTFAWADKETANKRFYSRKLWENVLCKKNVQEQLTAGMLGQVDHPADGDGDTFRVAIATKKLELKESGEVYGEAVILPTQGGELLKKIAGSGCVIGVSSRGRGAVDEQGRVNEETYQLITFDVVINPAVSAATPRISENINNTNTKKENEMSDLQKFYDIEKTITPTLRAIEDKKVDESIKDSIDELCKSAIARISELDEARSGLIKPVVNDLLDRIVKARKYLQSGELKENAEIKTVSLDGLNKKEPANPTNDANAQKPEGTAKSNEGKKDDDKTDPGVNEKVTKAYVEELEKANEELEKKYKEALWALEELKRANEEAEVQEAIDKEITKLVTEDKTLEDSKFLLEKANSIEEIHKIVQQLKGVGKKSPEKPKTEDDPKLPPPKSTNVVDDDITKTKVVNEDTTNHKKTVYDDVLGQTFGITVPFRRKY